ncbi:RES family NAD+ phosphorylase [Gemmatimonas groenlandica]|uniref:RES family NAD+ phosphorylase n=1 Tax=Gemmatimonas groenlandica TaxID=2732249 RepID=A0A6M4IUR3_9BACT|nr:RES family NAD+ phosphorylase [Gemmatimonas groenlandica]QJR37216.1 RES family NAD+ phosphorylase [Gemmatimonas groenlandica]
MSSNIWMQCAGDSELRALRLVAWRVVESQHEVSTRKLVSSAAEQELLEELIDRVKPPVTVGARLHYLLFTPFRYPPLRHGSRFGTRHERGIWYGSEQQRTAFAEVAYYRLLFLEGTHAELEPVTTALTSFTVRMRSIRAVDLAAPPFSDHAAEISSPVSYQSSQTLGRAMREAKVELFRFPSARDAEHGTNVGAFSPAVFHQATPQHVERWHCTATRSSVDFTRGDLSRVRDTHLFERAQFLVADRLPWP